MRYLSLFWISMLLVGTSCSPGYKENDLRKFFGSLAHQDVNIVVVDMDRCASCQYKSILELCSMNCSKLLLLIYVTNHAKKAVIVRDYGNVQIPKIPVRFFSEKGVMEAIAEKGDGSMFLIKKQEDNNLTIENIRRIEEVLPYCN